MEDEFVGQEQSGKQNISSRPGLGTDRSVRSEKQISSIGGNGMTTGMVGINAGVWHMKIT